MTTNGKYSHDPAVGFIHNDDALSSILLLRIANHSKFDCVQEQYLCL